MAVQAPTVEAPTVEELVKCSEADFDKAIQTLSLRDTMRTIEGLQAAMKKEQANFDSLKEQLEAMEDKKSRQCKQIAKDIASSQNRLTLLVNRNLKCFSLQNERSKASTLKRRSSTKGLAPDPPTIQRSHSMHLPTSPTESEPPLLTTTATPLTAGNPPKSNHAHGPAGRTVILMANGHVSGNKSVTRITPASSSPALNVVPKDTPLTASENGADENKESLPSVKKLAETFGSMQKKSVPNNIPPKALRPLSQEVRSSFGVQGSNSMSSSKSEAGRAEGKGDDTAASKPMQGKEATKVKTAMTVIPASNPTSETVKAQGKPVDSRQVGTDAAHSKLKPVNSGEGSKNKTTSSESGASAVKENSMKTNGESGEVTVPVLDNAKVMAFLDRADQAAAGSGVPKKVQSSVPSGAPKAETSKPLSKTGGSSAGGGSGFSAITVESKVRPSRDDLLNEIKARKKDDDTTDGPSQKSEKKTDSGGVSVGIKSSHREYKTDGRKAPAPPPPQSSAASQQVSVTEKQASSQISRTVQGGAKSAAGTAVSQTAAAGGGDVEGDEEVDPTPRMNLKDWDPIKLMNELYTLKLMEESVEDISHKFVHMEGYMEKLPMNKKKATLLKTWKRRFFKAEGGHLYYYETSRRDKPSDTINLMGGKIEDLGNRILGIDDGRGRFLMVCCPTEAEQAQWKLALQSQTEDNTKATFVRPVLRANPHPEKKVLIIDMGSSGIRAGRLGDQASLPELFFPTVVAVDNKTGQSVVGLEAYRPDIRARSTLYHPVRPTNKVDKFNIDMQLMPAIFEKIFKDLAVDPRQYWVMLSTPQNLGDTLRRELMELLVSRSGVKGVCMVQQSLLSLYSYNTNTGVLVDIGERTDILPIFDGLLIEGGVAKLPFGGQRVLDSLNTALLGRNYKFMSPTELLLVRYIMEKSCFVAVDFKATLAECRANPHKFETSVRLDTLDLPPEAYSSVTLDECRFSSPEGLFDTDLWEMDYPNLIKLVSQAIQACPMDSRRHMYRAVYLSGGLTLLPGFSDRLHAALSKVAPPGVPVEVHAAPQRYHAAYVGGCKVAAMPEFQMMAVSAEEWKKEGVKCFRKWATPSS